MDSKHDIEFRRYLAQHEDRLAAELGVRAKRRVGHVPALLKARGGSDYCRTRFKLRSLVVCAGAAHALRRGCFQRGLPLGAALDQALYLWATRPANVHPSGVVESYLGDSPLAHAPDALVAQVHPAAWGPFVERVRGEGQQLKAAARAACILWATTARSQCEHPFLKHRLAWEKRMETGEAPAVQAPGDQASEAQAQASEAQVQAQAQDVVDLL